GTPMAIAGDYKWSTIEVDKRGNARMSINARSLVVSVKGTERTAPPFENFEQRFGPNGLPDSLPFEESEFAYAVICIAQYVPANKTDLHKPFPIRWESADNKTKIIGTGTLESLKSSDGMGIAEIRCTARIVPASEMLAQIEWRSQLAVSNGRLRSCKGSFEALDGGGKFEIAITKVEN